MSAREDDFMELDTQPNSPEPERRSVRSSVSSQRTMREGAEISHRYSPMNLSMESRSSQRSRTLSYEPSSKESSPSIAPTLPPDSSRSRSPRRSPRSRSPRPRSRSRSRGRSRGSAGVRLQYRPPRSTSQMSANSRLNHFVNLVGRVGRNK